MSDPTHRALVLEVGKQFNTDAGCLTGILNYPVVALIVAVSALVIIFFYQTTLAGRRRKRNSDDEPTSLATDYKQLVLTFTKGIFDKVKAN